MSEPNGVIVFTTVGRPYYGFDIFSVKLNTSVTDFPQRRLTDGVSINFNAQFLDEDETIVYISERTGSPKIYSNRKAQNPVQLPSSSSLFVDRPTIRNGSLYFVSAHQNPNRPFKSWCAVYAAEIGVPDRKIVRLTPAGAVDYSPAVSSSGKWIAVASYGFRPWNGEFHELDTEIVVFRASEPERRVVVCRNGGWPSWCGDSTVFFHRKAEDGWWSVFRVDLPENQEISPEIQESLVPQRVTPPGVHAFTPAAEKSGKIIAVATRRSEMKFRQIELFDLETEKFTRVTEKSFHHYSPFFSPESSVLGFHRFRGESVPGSDFTVPNLEVVGSPVEGLKMVRLNGSFPSFSPDGGFIAFNHDFDAKSGVKIVRSDGSRSWTLVKDRVSFCVSWSRTEKGVVYTSMGPIFQSPRATVQIARITFDPNDLNKGTNEVSAEVKILTSEESGNNAFPSCSPGGKSLVFRSGRSGYKNLYIVDAVNGEFDGGIRRLTEGPWIDTMPNWSPDGELIAFSSNRHNPSNAEAFSIYLIRPDGTDVRRVYVAGPSGSSDVDRERINHVFFSLDSKWLLFTSNLGGVSAEPISLPNQFQPYGELYMARLDGSELQRLTWNAYENGTPTWHSGLGLDIGSLSLGSLREGEEKLVGQFDEPLWLTCDV